MERGTAWFGPGVPHRRLRWTRRGRRRMAQVTAEALGASWANSTDSANSPDRRERLLVEHHRHARRAVPLWAPLVAAVRGEPEVLRFCVTDGEVASTGPWLYAWVHLASGRVVHAGTTTLDPRVRAWVHLEDDSPERGRVAALVRSREDLRERDAFEVSAVRLPEDAPRPAAKHALLDALLASGALDEQLSERVTSDGAARSSSSSEEQVGAATRRSVDVLVREVLGSRWR